MNNNILIIGKSNKIETYLQKNFDFNITAYDEYNSNINYLFVLCIDDIDFNIINNISNYIILYNENNIVYNNELMNNCFKYYDSINQLNDLYHIFKLRNDYSFDIK